MLCDAVEGSRRKASNITFSVRAVQYSAAGGVGCSAEQISVQIKVFPYQSANLSVELEGVGCNKTGRWC